jgi:hypothetical protein
MIYLFGDTEEPVLQMARAGFAYTPQETGDDLATCLYCDVSLSGWDEQDDPMYSILLSMLHAT